MQTASASQILSEHCHKAAKLAC